MSDHPSNHLPGPSPAKHKAAWIAGASLVVVLVMGILIAALLRRPSTPRRQGTSPEAAQAEKAVKDLTETNRSLQERLAEAEQENADLNNQLSAAKSKPPVRSEPPPPQHDDSESYGPETNVRTLRADIPFKVNLKLDHGTLASKERVTKDSYAAEYTLSVRLPAPAKTLEELQTSNPKLGAILPGLGPILAKGEVSKFYYTLYDNKTVRLKKDATALNELLSKHNLFDCETILNLKSEGGRRAMLMQADMDVVSDGSDGDRLATMPDSITTSSNYQPTTSYGWAKKTPSPNPLLAGWEKRLAVADKEMSDKTTSADRKAWLRPRMLDLKKGISDMKARSYLIADYDPFIVVPTNIVRERNDPYAPGIGDYALVIYGDKVLPAIVGDAGPSYKVGEASLRIAKELSSRATPNNRPVSDLKVTYLMFPGTKDEFGPPDYDVWRAKCEALAKEIGGIGADFQLATWKNLFPPPAPPPAPNPSPNNNPVPPVAPQPPAPTGPAGTAPKIGPTFPPVNPAAANPAAPAPAPTPTPAPTPGGP